MKEKKKKNTKGRNRKAPLPTVVFPKPLIITEIYQYDPFIFVKEWHSISSLLNFILFFCSKRYY